MKTNLVRAALACAALALTSATAIANVIPGVDVIVKRHPPKDLAIPPVTTDAKGQATFKLAPGEYEIDIDGPTLRAAVDRIAPPKKKDRGSLSVGIGGSLFGGGSSHSSQKDSGHEGLDNQGEGSKNGHPSSNQGNSSSGGGVGVGMNIPVGGNDPGSNPPPSLEITMHEIIVTNLATGQPEPVSVDFPYCRDGGEGPRVEFTVPDGGGTVTMQMSIADQASAGNLTSY